MHPKNNYNQNKRRERPVYSNNQQTLLSDGLKFKRKLFTILLRKRLYDGDMNFEPIAREKTSCREKVTVETHSGVKPSWIPPSGSLFPDSLIPGSPTPFTMVNNYVELGLRSLIFCHCTFLFLLTVSSVRQKRLK